ncbi:MAG: alanine racemase [Micrococcus sp.]|nr:alanine racemase [Micrococcus sp.]
MRPQPRRDGSAPPYERYAAALGALTDHRARGPLGLVDLDAFMANAASMAQRAGGIPIRVATKSVRIRAAVDVALAQPGFSGVMTFTLPEALWLHSLGHRDLVVAYPSVDRRALVELLVSADARSCITLTIDSADHLTFLDDVARTAGLTAQAEATLPPVRLCLDLDAAWQPSRRVRFGALRSPVRTPEEARTLARAILDAPHRALVGMLAYEGQVAGLPDGAGPHAAAAQFIKRASIRDLRTRRPDAVRAVRALLREHGQDLEFVNGGGTGSLESTAGEGTVTEIGAGSGLMAPASFDGYTGFTLQPAQFFTCPVARRPRPDVVTVTGGGWTASGVPGRDRSPTVAWPPGLKYSRQEGAGEVQTPLHGPGAARLALGDPVFFRHAKAGEPAEHMSVVAVYSRAEDAIIDLWPTYRGEGKVFL